MAKRPFYERPRHSLSAPTNLRVVFSFRKQQEASLSPPCLLAHQVIP